MVGENNTPMQFSKVRPLWRERGMPALANGLLSQGSLATMPWQRALCMGTERCSQKCKHATHPWDYRNGPPMANIHETNNYRFWTWFQTFRWGYLKKLSKGKQKYWVLTTNRSKSMPKHQMPSFIVFKLMHGWNNLGCETGLWNRVVKRLQIQYCMCCTVYMHQDGFNSPLWDRGCCIFLRFFICIYIYMCVLYYTHHYLRAAMYINTYIYISLWTM